MEWTDDVIGRLKALWAEGHSTAEIGRRLGVSKNAVVGKAHRLSLAARPSPIRRGEPGAAKRRPSIRRVTGPTLPTMARPASGAPPPGRSVANPSAFARAPEPARAPASSQVSASVQAAPAQRVPEQRVHEQRAPEQRSPDLRVLGRAPGGRLVACCWPIGEPGTRSFRFCDVGSLPGKPYCSAHAALAYVKVRDRREDAA